MSTPRTRSGRRRRLPIILLLLGSLAIIAVILIVILVITLLQPGPPPIPGLPGQSTSPSAKRPEAQPADCPDVLTLIVPGTWESAPNDDPHHPTANPQALLRPVSGVLDERFSRSRTDVYTVPYVAQFRNPTNLADRQRDYNVSRGQGYSRAAAKITDTNKRCPLTRYLLMGFSQGAVIVGDLASNIGNGRGVLPSEDQDLVLGVGLIADGRREPGKQHDVGPSPPGVGAEVALAGMGSIVPGITLTGPRDGGFGSLWDRVQSICAPGDLICDSPTVMNPIGAIGQLANSIGAPVHAMYGTSRYWSLHGATATQWMTRWATGVLQDAPHPAHH